MKVGEVASCACGRHRDRLVPAIHQTITSGTRGRRLMQIINEWLTAMLHIFNEIFNIGNDAMMPTVSSFSLWTCSRRDRWKQMEGRNEKT